MIIRMLPFSCGPFRTSSVLMVSLLRRKDWGNIQQMKRHHHQQPVTIQKKHRHHHHQRQEQDEDDPEQEIFLARSNPKSSESIAATNFPPPSEYFYEIVPSLPPSHDRGRANDALQLHSPSPTQPSSAARPASLVFHRNQHQPALTSPVSASAYSLAVRRQGLAEMAWFYYQQHLLEREETHHFKHVMQTPCPSMYRVAGRKRGGACSLPHLTIRSQLKKRWMTQLTQTETENNTGSINNNNKNSNNNNTSTSSIRVDFPFLSIGSKSITASTGAPSAGASCSFIDESSAAAQDIFTIAATSDEATGTNSDSDEFFLRWVKRHVLSGAVNPIDLSSILVPNVVTNLIQSNSNGDTRWMLIDYCSFYKQEEFVASGRRSSASPTSSSTSSSLRTAQTVFCDVMFDVIEEMSSSSTCADVKYQVVVDHNISFANRKSNSDANRLKQTSVQKAYRRLLDELTELATEDAAEVELVDEKSMHQSSTRQRYADNANTICLVLPPSSCDCIRSFDVATGGSSSLVLTIPAGRAKRSDDSSSASSPSERHPQLPVDRFTQKLQTESEELFQVQSNLLYHSVLTSSSSSSSSLRHVINSKNSNVTYNNNSNNNNNNNDNKNSGEHFFICYGVPSPNPLEGEAVVCSVIQRLRNEGVLKSVEVPSSSLAEEEKVVLSESASKNRFLDIFCDRGATSVPKGEPATTIPEATNSLTSWYVPRECYTSASYSSLLPENIDEAIREIVAASSMRLMPWSTAAVAAGESAQQHDGCYFCVLDLKVNHERVRQIMATHFDDSDHRKQQHQLQHLQRQPYLHPKMSPSSTFFPLRNDANNTINKSINNYNGSNIDRVRLPSSSTSAPATATVTVISIYTLYTLLMKMSMSNNDNSNNNKSRNDLTICLRDVQDILRELSPPVSSGVKNGDVEDDTGSSNNIATIDSPVKIDLSPAYEIESWELIHAVLRSHQLQEQHGSSLVAVVEIEFGIGQELQVRQQGEDSDSLMSSLSTAIRETRIKFEIRKVEANSSIADDNDDDSDKDDVDPPSLVSVLRPVDPGKCAVLRDAIGYVLKCHGVDDVSDKGWKEFVMRKRRK